MYECKTGSFNFSNGKITKWKSTGIFNYLENSDLNVSLSATANYMPFLENNGRMNVKFNGYYLAQNKAIHPIFTLLHYSKCFVWCYENYKKHNQ